MRFALYLCVAIVVVNVLVSYQGSHVLAQAPFSLPVMGTPTITLEAIFFGIAMSVRLLAIVSAFAILTLTVSPDDLMRAMMKMKLPYKSVLVMALSTRFLPTLFRDVAQIADVQRTRGLELDVGNLPRRIKNRMAVIIPLLSNSLDRTVQIAEAMESRAFGTGQKRAFYRDEGTTRADLLTVALALAPCVLGIALVTLGYGEYEYYPTLGTMSLSGTEWSMLLILVLLVSSVVLLPFLKMRVGFD
jgi:energy-coupling factor transport system permease protein